MIVGIVGRKGSGKTSAANRLVEEWNFIRLAFADPLKKFTSEIFNVPLEWMYDENLKNEPIAHLKEQMSARKLLQWFGTDAVRSVYPEAWLTLMQKNLVMLKDRDVVIDDVRFYNEAYLIQNLDGHLIGVEVEGEDKSDTHGSERYIESIHEKMCEQVYSAPKGLPQLYEWVDKVALDLKNAYGEISVSIEDFIK